MRRFQWLSALLLCPVVAWSAEIRSLSLEQAIQIALEQNRSLKVAQARLKSSQYGVKEARGALFPRLAAKASYTRLDQRPYIAPSNFDRMFEPLIVPFADLVARGYLNPASLAGLQNAGIDKIYTGLEDNYDFNLSLEQPLFTGGAIRNSYRIATLSTQAELWNYRRDEEEVRYEVTQAFLNLVKAHELVRVAQESIGRSQVHLTDLENLRTQGLAIERDLLRARVALSNAQLQNIHAQNARKLATSRLCHLLALDLDTEIAPTAISGLKPDSLESQEIYMARALEARPEMKAMNVSRAIAERQIAMCKGEFLPKAFVVGNYDWKRPNREIEPEFYATWNMTLALQLDLFHGGAKYYRLQKANWAVRQINESSAILTDAVRLEVKQSYLALEEAREALKIAGEVVVQAEESYRVTRSNFKAGTATNADVLDAQSELTQAEMQQVTARADLLLARAKLVRASGG